MNAELIGLPWLITEPAFRDLEAKSRNPDYIRMEMGFCDQFLLSQNDYPPYDVYGSVAVITCHGGFTKRSSWWSYRFTGDRVHFAITHAIQNPSITSIVLDIDSPGGTVSGTKELADFIFAARSDKRIIAIANDMACSSALWIGSSASEFVTTDSAFVGSLGVLWARMDWTKMNDKIGIKVHLFGSGEAKTWGWPDTEMSDSEKADKLATIETLANQFIEGMARNRGVTPAEARSQWASARTWIGQDAVSVGLCDRVSTLDKVVAELSGQQTNVRERGNPNGEESTKPSGSISRQRGRGQCFRFIRTTRR